MDKAVAILMSTFNGEKYLSSQIDSIIKQTYKNWHLYIRDDGSSDGTRDIIQQYSNKYSNITFFNKNNMENKGVVKSFMELLEKTDADYYMFSDQDDVWLPKKVELSINKIQNDNVDTPLCVFSELKVVDANLNPIRLMNNKNIWFDFIHFMFGNCVTGCTILINRSLKEKLQINKTNLSNIYMHDWWIALYASAFGKLLYIKHPTLLYRQHSSNVEGSQRNTPLHLIKRSLNIKNEEQGMLSIFNMDYEFNRMFGKKLSGINKNYIDSYTNLPKNSSFLYNLNLIKKYPPKRAHLKGDILFSYLLLFHSRSLLSGNK
ncbi:glycosyltransferase family 2 protein [Limosilactobacillus fastidiosus]|uniref:Glycosyltransferase family 2 protein n=1 Tax=Limosilactobacillus fastidiosus TaxID=2759855 RepID=A0ABR6E7H1_9LACO|nr:glycosyltransferase family 2 protein [Limosilactobacillus fastidiosus]MBB1063148.1 glycosyltransferase family 2 protein [Limosilactobacillus fastidiosus]MCD7084914.1 glycosyltransferase family 2 protein [Limosilactobacillus fastidiosus]